MRCTTGEVEHDVRFSLSSCVAHSSHRHLGKLGDQHDLTQPVHICDADRRRRALAGAAKDREHAPKGCPPVSCCRGPCTRCIPSTPAPFRQSHPPPHAATADELGTRPGLPSVAMGCRGEGGWREAELNCRHADFQSADGILRKSAIP